MLRVLALLAALFISGCVSHILLVKQIPPIDYSSPRILAVSVVDDRQRVKKGKPRNFIGVAHGIFGIPFDWHINPVLAVEDGDKNRDLAQFLLYRIAHGFAERGWSVIELALEDVPDDEKARALLGEKVPASCWCYRLANGSLVSTLVG